MIVGRFNYDAYQDFAALIISSERQRYIAGNYSYDYYPGKVVVCFGDRREAAFRCEAEAERPITLPNESVLRRVPPGKYTCQEEDRIRTIVTEIDSVGEEVSDKGASFRSVNRSGTTYVCVTSD